MRATYEDLLRVARRRAVEAYNSAGTDTSDLIGGWQAMLSATRNHLRWLRLELLAEDFTAGADCQGAGPLFLLAQSIGAGADLLASQNGSTSIVLDDEKGLEAARSEVATAAAMGARAALTRLANGQIEPAAQHGPLYHHVVGVLAELEFLRQRGTAELGSMGGLTTRLPTHPVDIPSRITRLAAEWHIAHEATAPRELLTRDLRSTSAQLRTVAGYLTQIARLLHAVEDGRPDELRSLVASLRDTAAAEARVAQTWRTRMSDAHGRSDGCAEDAFIQLLEALQGWLRDGERLKQPDEVVVDAEAAGRIGQVVDEIAHAGHLVAALREESVAWLIRAGRLFVPRAELAKRDPEFDYRPSVWRLRYPQPHWVRTARESCFDELTAALADVTSHFAAAAGTSRRLAGTDAQLRPYGLGVRPMPRAMRRSPAHWYRPVADIPSIYAEAPGPNG